MVVSSLDVSCTGFVQSGVVLSGLDVSCTRFVRSGVVWYGERRGILENTEVILKLVVLWK